MVARILACVGIESERWAMRHVYALASKRRLAVSRVSGATGCGLGTARRRVDIYTGGTGEPPDSRITGNRGDA